MSDTKTTRVCAFCGQQGDASTRYGAGFGVLIDEGCIGFFTAALEAGKGTAAPIARRETGDLSDGELLDTLPRITATASQVSRFMAQWVDHIRARKLSWTTIGNAMGISRQAAWERFTRPASADRVAGSR